MRHPLQNPAINEAAQQRQTAFLRKLNTQPQPTAAAPLINELGLLEIRSDADLAAAYRDPQLSEMIAAGQYRDFRRNARKRKPPVEVEAFTQQTFIEA